MNRAIRIRPQAFQISEVSPPILNWLFTPALFVWLFLYHLSLLSTIMAKTKIGIILNNIEVNIIYLDY